MKIIFVYTLFALLFNSCANNVDIEKEKEAIKAVIESETRSYLMKDIDQRSKSFLHDKSVIILVSGKRSYGYTVGYDQIFENHKKSVKKDPIPSTNSFKNTNYKITVYEKSAWQFTTK